MPASNFLILCCKAVFLFCRFFATLMLEIPGTFWPMSASLVNVLQRIYANLVLIAPNRIEFHEIKVKVYFSPHVPALFFESMHYVKPNFEKMNISLPLPEVSVANIERCVFIAVLDRRPWIRILSQNARYKIFCCESHHIVLLTNNIHVVIFLGSHAP